MSDVPLKRRRTARTTISIPVDTYERMRRFPMVNWSAVASRAFLDTLNTLEAERPSLALEGRRK